MCNSLYVNAIYLLYLNLLFVYLKLLRDEYDSANNRHFLFNIILFIYFM